MMQKLLLAAVVAVLAAPAGATVVDFTNIRATWFDPIGGTNVNYIDNGTDHAKVRWGTSKGDGQSGYDFNGVAIPALTVSPPSGSDEASIGIFTHVNKTIASNTSIAGIKLKFETDVYIDGDFYRDVTFFYDFTHWETPNDASPCANGGRNDRGININGCADNVKINFNEQSDGFTINEDGVDYIYALNIAGFLIDGDPMDSFWTKEKATNDAYIRGNIVLYSQLVPGVPEPTSWAMLVAGFGLMGMAFRRGQRRPGTAPRS